MSPGAATSGDVVYRKALYGLFILSGAAGLLYESLWARYLGLFVGHSAYAQLIVLAIFLGGMAVGSLLVASRTEKLRDPLLAYAAMEALIGLGGLAFHPLFGAITERAYTTLFPWVGTGLGLHAVKWSIAAGLILPQSVLLGTTFPLMSAGILRRDQRQPGNTLSTLYFANSIGAAAGVLVAGFWLLGVVGLHGAIVTAAIINLGVAGLTLIVRRAYGGDRIVWAAARRGVPKSAVGLTGDDERTATAKEASSLSRLLLGVAFGTAVASFIYEIGWIRMLSLVLGSATHSFELMLSAFILGLALGAYWVRKRLDTWSQPVRVVGIVQWIMGAAALATLPLYGASFYWMDWLVRVFPVTDMGYAGFSLARYGISLAIMLPATFCAGMVLPLITRILLLEADGEKAIGRVYGLNTLGAILGVGVAGLYLLPAAGLKGTLVIGATLDMAIGSAVLLYLHSRSASHKSAAGAAGAVASTRNRGHRNLAVASTTATLAAAALALSSPDFHPLLMSSGVFRGYGIPSARHFDVPYHEDGRTATVTVTRVKDDGFLTISTNGKPDASLSAYWFEECPETGSERQLEDDESTQLLAPMITLAHRRHGRRGAVIGQGSGMSSHFLLASPGVEELVTLEIEPAMVEGSREFYPANRRVFDDPRGRIVYDDARSYFAAAPEPFDFVFSEPSNPWVSGVSSLFTRQFYEMVRDHLSVDGVFGQWLHLYEISDDLVLTVLSAIHSSFGDYEVFLTSDTDMVIVATTGERLPVPDWTVFGSSALSADLCRVTLPTPSMLEAARLIGRRSLGPLLDSWTLQNTDYRPILDLGAESARFLGYRADGFVGLSEDRFVPAAIVTGRRVPPSADSVSPTRYVPRMVSLARGTRIRSALRSMKDPTSRDPAGLEAPPDSEFVARTETIAAWFSSLDGAEPPLDWQAWIRELGQVEAELYGGTLGYIEPGFYEAARGYVQRVSGPPLAGNVIEFRAGLAGWDFAAVEAAGKRIAANVMSDDPAIEPDVYLDGMTMAMLARGDAKSARESFDRFEPLGSRYMDDLRLRLLNAYIEAAEDGSLELATDHE